jgi:hypothetical protein
VDEGGRDDDTGAELLNGHEDIGTDTPNHEFVQEQGSEDADGTCDEDDEERTNSQSHVVFALTEAARDPFTCTPNTVPVVPCEQETTAKQDQVEHTRHQRGNGSCVPLTRHASGHASLGGHLDGLPLLRRLRHERRRLCRPDPCRTCICMVVSIIKVVRRDKMVLNTSQYRAHGSRCRPEGPPQSEWPRRAPPRLPH